MTLIEAIKSGRPFRREEDGAEYGWNYPSQAYSYSTDDILADDWEIKEPTVTITRTQFLETFGQMYCHRPWSKYQVDSDFGIVLARKLGLEAKD